MMNGIIDFLFPKPSIEDIIVKWRKELRYHAREINRTITEIEISEIKTKREIGILLKRNDKTNAKTLAKAIIHSRKTKYRLHVTKAHLNSASMHLQHILSNFKLNGHLKKSSEVMESMNKAIKLPEMHETIMVMVREMEKAGIIEEMLGDMLEIDNNIEDDEIEVNRVLSELSLSMHNQLPTVIGMTNPEQRYGKLYTKDLEICFDVL